MKQTVSLKYCLLIVLIHSNSHACFFNMQQDLNTPLADRVRRNLEANNNCSCEYNKFCNRCFLQDREAVLGSCLPALWFLPARSRHPEPYGETVKITAINRRSGYSRAFILDPRSLRWVIQS